MWSFERKKQIMVAPEHALVGRAEAMPVRTAHAVLARPLTGPYPEGCEQLLLGMGCFWGAEKVFWAQQGIHVTAVGYSAGYTPNPTYEEVCTGLTGHNEVVLVVYFPQQISTQAVLQLFWESHNPTTPMQQAADIGTQYRSGIYCFNAEQLAAAQLSKSRYQTLLGDKNQITSEIQMAQAFYFAEPYHQQYLAKNPGGYCNLQTITKTGLPKYVD
jgi:peptide-methionine (S)-S-oxide reductase